MAKETTFEDMAEQAEALEAEATDDVGTYTHVLKKPITIRGKEYTELTFDFESLSGVDSTIVKGQLRRKGITVVLDAYTPEFMSAMAARACTLRDDDNKRVFTAEDLERLPLKAYNKITGKLRNFLQTAE